MPRNNICLSCGAAFHDDQMQNDGLYCIYCNAGADTGLMGYSEDDTDDPYYLRDRISDLTDKEKETDPMPTTKLKLRQITLRDTSDYYDDLQIFTCGDRKVLAIEKRQGDSSNWPICLHRCEVERGVKWLTRWLRETSK